MSKGTIQLIHNIMRENKQVIWLFQVIKLRLFLFGGPHPAMFNTYSLLFDQETLLVVLKGPYIMWKIKLGLAKDKTLNPCPILSCSCLISDIGTHNSNTHSLFISLHILNPTFQLFPKSDHTICLPHLRKLQ